MNTAQEMTAPVDRDLLVLAPGPGNPRNSEGSFVHLHDGRILYVYTHFTGGAGDHAEAHLASRSSADGGQTWTPRDATVVAEPGYNVMSVSLLRVADGRIALFYLLKRARNDWRVLMRTSSDEGTTWSVPTQCNRKRGKYVLNNDRALLLRSGRILLPVAYAGLDEPYTTEQTMTVLYSDDAGGTWQRGRDLARVPGVWTQEPGVVELADGCIMMFCRTQVGCQYWSRSADNGETWTPLAPSPIVSTLSPATIKRIPGSGELLMIWNCVDQPWQSWEVLQRSPLNVAVSRDEGESWENARVLEHAPDHWFCYSAVTFVGRDVLVGYGSGSGEGAARLATGRIARYPLSWLLPGAGAKAGG